MRPRYLLDRSEGNLDHHICGIHRKNKNKEVVKPKKLSLENTVLSEIIQAEKDKYCTMSLK
jgi:hypothetical protein